MEEGKFPNGYAARRRVTVPAEAIDDGWVRAPVLLGQRDVRFEMPDGTPLTAQMQRGLMWVKVPLLAEDEETTFYVYYDRGGDAGDDFRRRCVYQVETTSGVGQVYDMLVAPTVTNWTPPRGSAQEALEEACEVAASTTVEEAEAIARHRLRFYCRPVPAGTVTVAPEPEPEPLEPQRPEVRVILGGDEYAVRPKRDITPYEATMLGLFLRWEDGDYAANVLDWLVEHDLLRHFEMVEG